MDRDEMLETIKFILDSYDDDYLQVIYDSVTATLQSGEPHERKK